jgi:glycosyltransferase involved in cell wall biosynthesis
VTAHEWSIGIVVPARNEAGLIEGCLRALRSAVEEVVHEVAAIEVVVVADSCTDATATIARRVLDGWGRVLEVAAGTAGAARRLGIGSVLASLQTQLHRIWLANTDGDTQVSPDWVRQQLSLARNGAIAVAGVVDVDSFEEHPPGFASQWRRRYVPTGPTHRHVHGANLGVRADAYLGVGGFDGGAAGEDQRLWVALRDAGHPTRSPTSLLVTTSGRARGRATGGFADTLCRLAEVVCAA